MRLAYAAALGGVTVVAYRVLMKALRSRISEKAVLYYWPARGRADQIRYSDNSRRPRCPSSPVSQPLLNPSSYICAF
jgi:hypothetical protein